MGFSVLRRALQKGGAGLCRSAGIFRSRTYCSFSGRISEKGAGLPPSRISPLLMLPPLFDESGNVVYKFHSLGNKEQITYKKKRSESDDELPLPDKLDDFDIAGSSHGWLAVHNWTNHDVYMLNPITGRRINLPSLRSLPDLDVNLTGGVSRLALSCSPDDDTQECRAMMIFGAARRLAFCVPRRSTEWTPIGNLYLERLNIYDKIETVEREYEDVVYSTKHKLFFCITRYSSELEAWDITEPLSPMIEWRLANNEEFKFDSPDYPWPSRSVTDTQLKEVCWHIKYLLYAEEMDKLFLVVRHVNPRMRQDGSCAIPIFLSKFRGGEYSYPYKTFDFDVFKIDWRYSGELTYMKSSLEGLTMFVGTNQSFALSASEFPELKPNSIYYSDEYRLMRQSRSFVLNEYGGHDNGIFDYQNNTFSSCCGHCPLNPLPYNPIMRIEPPPIKRIEPPPLWFAPPTL